MVIELFFVLNDLKMMRVALTRFTGVESTIIIGTQQIKRDLRSVFIHADKDIPMRYCLCLALTCCTWYKYIK